MDSDLLLNALSVTAIFTTILLFLTGIPICQKIYKMQITGDISGAPFLMGFLMGSFWFRYGIYKNDYTILTINVICSILYCCYCLFYIRYAHPKKDFIIKFSIVISLIILMNIFMLIAPDIDMLGISCLTINILMFGAPLASLGLVMEKKTVESLPLPMCCFNLIVSSQWYFYGKLKHDTYVMIPNGVGILLALFQLSLFIIYPRKPDTLSPLQRWFGQRTATGPTYAPGYPETIVNSEIATITPSSSMEESDVKIRNNGFEISDKEEILPVV